MRPFMKYRTDEIVRLLEEYPGDQDVLLELLYEVRSRSSSGQQRIELELLKRLGAGNHSQSAAERPAPAGMVSPEAVGGPRSDGRVEDFLQQAVIDASPESNLIVNAPPGTGKTFVACRRIERLLDEGIAPARIWMISFTRTAVRELRNRMSATAHQNPDLYGVLITTLDSRAWQLVQGFNGASVEGLSRGYAGTIRDAISLIRSNNEDVAPVLGRLAHVIVDEAQDFVGERAELVEAIMDRIRSTCGMTVLTDDAQAIFGWSEDDSEGGVRGLTLPERLRTATGRTFEEINLCTVHRTSSPALTRLFVESRAELLEGVRGGTPGLVRFIKERIRSAGEPFSGALADLAANHDALLLYRSRAEVMWASARFLSLGVPHRIRMPGMPICLHPWIALAFAGISDPRITEETFRKRWDLVREGLGALAPDLDETWSNLMRAAGDGSVVDLTELRRVLSRQRPPEEFCSSELGLYGPIVSTIHASKGRESDDAYLFLPDWSFLDDDEAEEARVLFVGATRGRRRLMVGEGPNTYMKRLERSARRASRVFGARGGPFTAQVEVGFHDDCDAAFPVRKSSVPAEGEATLLQEHLAGSLLGTKTVTMRAAANGCGEIFLVDRATPPAFVIGALSVSATSEMREAARTLWPGTRLTLPHQIDGLHMMGSRTVVLSPDDAAASTVHLPWRMSGFWLTPVVLGTPSITYCRA